MSVCRLSVCYTLMVCRLKSDMGMKYHPHPHLIPIPIVMFMKIIAGNNLHILLLLVTNVLQINNIFQLPTLSV